MTTEFITERNAQICKYYQDGHKLSECASKFKLGRQRVLQILKEGGVWVPYASIPRAKKTFLGVSIDEDTKERLSEKAKEEGVSVSKLTDDILSDALTPAPEQP